MGQPEIHFSRDMPVHQFQEPDSKKSPLALLVQICSNIGADKHDSKPLISSSSSSSSTSSSVDKSHADNDKAKEVTSSPHPDSHSSETKRPEGLSDHGKKTPSSKSNSPNSISPSGRASEDCGKSSPTVSEASVGNSKQDAGNKSADRSASTPNSGSQSTLSGLGYNTALGLDLGRSDATPTKDGFSSMSHLGLGAFKSAVNGLNSLSNCSGCSPVVGPIPVDAVSTAHTYAASIATQSGAAGLKSSGYPLGAGLSPYMVHARMKSGASAAMPLCRDPYCANCQLSSQLSCSTGSLAFTPDRLAAHFTATPGLSSAFLPGLTGSLTSAQAATSSLNPQLYSHSMLTRPNVCSWMVGDTYCGKRFATSEELLQHLRTHTSLSANSTLPLFSPGLHSVSGLEAAAACGLHYSTAMSLSTSANLRRNYPTSLSPISSLSAASRYHPYKPPLPTLSGAALPPLAHPGLSMYYSPYSVYGKG